MMSKRRRENLCLFLPAFSTHIELVGRSDRRSSRADRTARRSPTSAESSLEERNLSLCRRTRRDEASDIRCNASFPISALRTRRVRCSDCAFERCFPYPPAPSTSSRPNANLYATSRSKTFAATDKPDGEKFSIDRPDGRVSLTQFSSFSATFGILDVTRVVDRGNG